MKMVALSILMSIMFCHAGTMDFMVNDDGFQYPMSTTSESSQCLKMRSLNEFNLIVCHYDTQIQQFMIEILCEPDSSTWFKMEILNSENIWFDEFLD